MEIALFLLSLCFGSLFGLHLDQRWKLRALEARIEGHQKAILWLIVACKQAGVGMQGLLAIQQQLKADVDRKTPSREKHPFPTEGQVN